MVYLKSFKLMDAYNEYQILLSKKNIFNTLYPLQIFPSKELKQIDFETITIFYGGNGSGKTTLLNIISSKIGANKKSANNKGELFEQYVDNCNYEIQKYSELKDIKYIASDDIFDYLLDIRAINSGVNRRKGELTQEYFNLKNNPDRDKGILEYDEIRNINDSRKMTPSKFIRNRLIGNNIVEMSNGEQALNFWQKEINDNSIYLLDEPENSLSAENQIKLKKFLEESARFYNCQFIISTHSPFLLGLEDAKIYDLDEVPVQSKKWVDLKNVRVYYDFFKENEEKFN